ncbi:1,4-beta-xylanase [Mucilaginibacter sp. L3T2-6]|uniref:1,4-beta-xylanase n=1 Tax=Mucilaginibacter sp. L3T2-6 TaxID=3062491 RepID=UPI0026754CC8|nr:1,4-beta-xylanase [Mucilaginibacter sp. L3T2-6]MDO3641199.1 1,4-beta-xylanase [Mucilaginibacter sp. L3T2-6]MDV6213325.1 1,4-beta-xylanase [Mucilaginibacter sp. L3T2-6]
MRIKLVFAGLLLLCSAPIMAQKKTAAGVWPAARANAWYAKHKWINGANFTPSTAINQLEMWQADTFDPTTIDRELGYAEGIGFNAMRVFLHSLVWKEDPKGFKSRINKYLEIADKHHIQTIFVFFDDCWNPNAKPGKQPEPKPGIHNSGWMQDPGYPLTKEADYAALKVYVDDILTTFKHDKRILLWDLYNEPGNGDKNHIAHILLPKVFAWAHAINPDQPVSSGMWDWNLEAFNRIQLQNSDVITYHCYDSPELHERVVKLLKIYGRPLICTEYMARPRNSTFENTMPMLKRENVGAINWGFVSGKTNTIYAWDTPMPDGSEPKLWFHDVFRKNGEPYKREETDLIKKLNGK